YQIQGEISRVQWRRFVEISNRIVTLVVDCKLAPAMHGKLLIAEKTFGGTPFAKLRNLEVRGETTNWSTTSLFVVPSVKDMKIEADPRDEDPTKEMLDIYMIPFTLKLESLDVTLRDSEWLPHVGQFPNLQKLTCCIERINPTTWKNLGDRLNLTQLSVTEADPPSSADDEWNGIEVVFPALKELKLVASTRAITGAILHSVMPRLETLRLESDSKESPNRQTIVGHLSSWSPLLDESNIILIWTPVFKSNFYSASGFGTFQPFLLPGTSLIW
ncbi:hypothetical protein FRB90_009216, partial [Tulasnella sp. 427]